MLKSSYYGGWTLLGNLRIFRMLLILFLTLGIFTNSLIAHACFCGEDCLHGFQDKTRVSFPFHNRCSGTHCKSCNFEDGQSLKAANYSSRAGNFNIFDTLFIGFILKDYYSNNHIIKSFFSQIYAAVKVHSLPIYLQNCSLLF